jgi:diguanylate cyclase (GGDEF)-like protein
MQNIIRTALERNELQEMGQYLADHIGILIQANHCFLNLWDEAKHRPIPLAAYGEFRGIYKKPDILPNERTFTASALEARQVLVEENVKESPYCSPRISAKYGSSSMLILPMIVNDQKLGAVMLGFKDPHKFSSEEIIMAEQATALVAIALAKLSAMEDAHRRAEESETLRRVGITVSETLNLKEATTRLLEQLAFVLPHDSASVQLLRDGYFEVINGEGWSNTSNVIGLRFPVEGNNPNNVVYQTRQPYLLNDAAAVHEEFRHPPHDHIRSWLGMPLMVRNELIGLLAIDSHEPNHFTQDDIELVNAFAGQVAVAVENARLFDETQRLAISDGLTGLFNRRHLLTIAEVEFERARRYKRNLAAMIFDIDHFKQINDTYGHAAGDHVLQAVGQVLRDSCRIYDVPGRYGGEEFCLMLPETKLERTVPVAERIRSRVEGSPVTVASNSLHVTVSIGIAGLESVPEEALFGAGSLLERADRALYAAKDRGRNRVETWSASLLSRPATILEH